MVYCTCVWVTSPSLAGLLSPPPVRVAVVLRLLTMPAGSVRGVTTPGSVRRAGAWVLVDLSCVSPSAFPVGLGL